MADTLSRQHTNAQSARWSIYADNQLRDVLETLFSTLPFAAGILAKGQVSATAAFSVAVETGTVAFCEGVIVTLSGAGAYAGLTPSTTNYLWGLVTRTARNRNTVSAEDTFALALSHNTSGTAPTALSIPLATIVTNGAAITSIDQAPAGKYPRFASPFAQNRETIASGETFAIDSGQQVSMRELLTVSGTLIVKGHLYVA